MRRVILVGLFAAFLMVLPISGFTTGMDSDLSRHSGDLIDAIYGTMPVLDGKIGIAEWTDASHYIFDVNGNSYHLYLKETGTRLYLATSFHEMNMVEFYFDVNNDGGNSPRTDDFKIHSSLANWEGKGDGSEWVNYYDPRGWQVVSDDDYFVRESYLDYDRLGITEGINSSVGFMFGAWIIPNGDVYWPDSPDFNSPGSWGDLFSSYHWGDGSALNEAPFLSEASLNPPIGTSEEKFEFSVSYRDPDGDEPVRKMVVVDGMEFEMSGPDTGLDEWSVFETTLNLDPGVHEHYFLFDDGTTEARYPEEGSISGPMVEVPNEPPFLVTGGIPSDIFSLCEDTDDPCMIDLESFFGDDRDDGRILFDIAFNSEEDSVKAHIEGSRLCLIPVEENWYGKVELRIGARDSGIAGLPVEDHSRRTESNDFFVEISPVNDLPFFEMIDGRDVTEKSLIHLDTEAAIIPGTELRIDLVVNDPDSEGIQGLSVGTSDPRWMVSRTGDCFEVSFTPGEQDIGRCSVDLRLTDEVGGTDILTLSLDVEEEPHSPKISHVIVDRTIVAMVDGKCVLGEELSIMEGKIVSIDVIAHDEDVEKGNEDHMTFLVENRPDFLSIDINTGRITISPDQDDIGKHMINVSVRDLTGDSADDNVEIEFQVVNENDPPVEVRIMSLYDGDEFKENETLELVCSFHDPDLLIDGFDSHIIQWTSDTDGPIGTGNNLKVSDLTPGGHLISLRVTDSWGLSGEDSVFITISESDDDTDWAPVNENDDLERSKAVPVELILIFSVASVLIWIISLAAFLLMRSKADGTVEQYSSGPLSLPVPSVSNRGNIENGVGTIPVEGGNRY